MDKISVIVPCYNEEQTVELFYSETSRVADNMTEAEFEFIFVNDGSADKTQEKLEQLAQRDSRVLFISFSRNFGKEAAMYAGLNHARGDYVVIMDADLQHPPAVIPKMYEIIKRTGCDCVATRRVTREKEPPIRSFFAHRFYNMFNRLCGLDVVDGAMDFRMMSAKMAKSIADMPEHGRFSKGIFAWVGFKTEWIEYENVERAAGETKWSFKKLLMYAVDGFTSFSFSPLYLPIWLGVLCILAAAVLAVLSAVGVSVAYLPVMLLLLCLFGVQLSLIGVLGHYISRISAEVRGRPLYIIGKTNIGEDKQKVSAL